MGVLDDAVMGIKPQATQPAAPQQSINGVPIPAAAKMDMSSYLDAPQQQEQDPLIGKAAGKVGQIVQKLQIEPTDENLQNVIMGVAKGRPMDPRALIKDRKSTLQQELEEAVATLKGDNDFRSYAEAIQSGRDQELRNAQYSKFGLKKYDKDAAEASVDPRLKAIGEAKLKIIGARIEGLQQQMLKLDETENKLLLGGALSSDADYQDLIKALITGQNIPTSLERLSQEESSAIATDRLAFDKQKSQQDLTIEGLKAQQTAEQNLFNREKDIADIGIKQQNADSQRISAEKDSMRANKVAQSLKNKQVEAQQTLNMVKDISQSFNADLQTAPTKLLAGVNKILDSMGIDVGADGKKLIRGMTEQEQGIGQLFNQYRKMITGAAAAMAELKFLEQTFVNNKNSPEEAKVGLQRFLKMAIRDSKVFQEMADAGVNINDKNELNGFYDTAVFRYNLNDPELVNEAMRAAPSLFYDKPLDDKDKKVLENGGKMVVTPNGVKILDADSLRRAIQQGYIKE